MSTCKIKLIEGLVSKDQSLDDLSLELFAAVGDIADAIIFKDDISHKIGCAFAVVISIHKLRLYDYSMDSRVARITHWLQCTRPVPKGVWSDLKLIADQRKSEVENAIDLLTLSVEELSKKESKKALK